MDDVKYRYTAKRGKFKGLLDEPETWRMLYKNGGEDLLREYAEHMQTEHDFFADRPDAGFKGRLCLVLESIWLSPEQFWHYAFKSLTERERYYLSGNKHCPENLLEAIWIGDYRHVDGSPKPYAVANCAYFNNYRKALSIYARRPELRVVVQKPMRDLYEYSLKYEGITLFDDHTIYRDLNMRKIN
jgi:hypothetical protein